MSNNLILRYGILGGLLVAAMMLGGLAMMANGLSYGLAEVLGYLSMLIAFSTIFLAIRQVRDHELGGSISFGRAFKTGILITLIVSAIYVAAWMGYVLINGNTFMETYFLDSRRAIETSGKSAEEMARLTQSLENMMEMYKNPFVQVAITFLEIFPVGALVSLLSAFLLRKK